MRRRRRRDKERADGEGKERERGRGFIHKGGGTQEPRQEYSAGT